MFNRARPKPLKYSQFRPYTRARTFYNDRNRTLIFGGLQLIGFQRVTSVREVCRVYCVCKMLIIRLLQICQNLESFFLHSIEKHRTFATETRKKHC